MLAPLTKIGMKYLAKQMPPDTLPDTCDENESGSEVSKNVILFGVISDYKDGIFSMTSNGAKQNHHAPSTLANSWKFVKGDKVSLFQASVKFTHERL